MPMKKSLATPMRSMEKVEASATMRAAKRAGLAGPPAVAPIPATVTADADQAYLTAFADEALAFHAARRLALGIQEGEAKVAHADYSFGQGRAFGPGAVGKNKPWAAAARDGGEYAREEGGFRIGQAARGAGREIDDHDVLRTLISFGSGRKSADGEAFGH
jgi:hypothetical protein